ncbi:MAG: tryptophan-rich sensory protein [Actinomycetaceae bacterium]|nr:tryptophan-rich sensory protein [Actinomycetaceae bacterium]
MTTRTALVTGATGYVGSKLVGILARNGWGVKVLVRSAQKARRMPWASLITDCEEGCHPGHVYVVEGDANNAFDVEAALEGVSVAWYLLHSMGNEREFVEEERSMAQIFAGAVERAGTERIVFLGALAPLGEKSAHLESRREVGQILASSGALTVGLSAGLVIGERSSSFAMLRHLAERLPVIVAPSWMHNRITPISEKDLLYLLESAGSAPISESRLFDIGSAEEVSYVEMLTRYIDHFGLRRRAVWTAPIANARTAAWIIGLLTPVDRHLAEPLLSSMVHDTVVIERDFREVVGEPPGGLDDIDEAYAATASFIKPWRWRRIFAGVTGLVTAAATVGSAFTAVNSPWYRSLNQPAWKPPRWLFPVAWSFLYADIALMSALTLADIGEADPSDVSTDTATSDLTREESEFIAALAVNLGLNAAWPCVFFNRKNLPGAVVEGSLLATSSADLVRRVWRVNTGRGIALAPYALWTAYAATLTFGVVRRNR